MAVAQLDSAIALRTPVSGEAANRLIADIVNEARPGHGSSIVLDGVDHGLRRVASIEDAFRRWGTRAEFDPQVVTTLMAWAEKVRLRR